MHAKPLCRFYFERVLFFEFMYGRKCASTSNLQVMLALQCQLMSNNKDAAFIKSHGGLNIYLKRLHMKLFADYYN